MNTDIFTFITTGTPRRITLVERLLRFRTRLRKLTNKPILNLTAVIMIHIVKCTASAKRFGL